MNPAILYTLSCLSGTALGILIGFAIAGLLTQRQRSHIASKTWSEAAAHFHDLYNATPIHKAPSTKPQSPLP